MSQDPFDNIPELSTNDKLIIMKYVEKCGSFILHNNTPKNHLYRILINAYRECLDVPLPSTISEEGKKAIYQAFFMAGVNVNFERSQKRRRVNNGQTRSTKRYISRKLNKNKLKHT